MYSEPLYMFFFARVADMLNTLRDVPGQRSVLVGVKQCLGRTHLSNLDAIVVGDNFPLESV